MISNPGEDENIDGFSSDEDTNQEELIFRNAEEEVVELHVNE